MKKFYIKNHKITNKNCKTPITIAHISDLHYYIGMNSEMLFDIYYEFEQTKPDIICFTGDLLEDAKLSQNSKVKSTLHGWIYALSSVAPIFIIRGNHDSLTKTKNGWLYYNTDEFFEYFKNFKNVHVLNNETITLNNVAVSGLDTGMHSEEYYTEQIEALESFKKLLKPSLTEITRELAPDALNLLMVHSPRNILSEIDSIYNIILSGHMHNGILPNFLDKMIKGNRGLLAPIDYKPFIENARGEIITPESASFIASPLQVIAKCHEYPLIKTLYKPGLSYIHVKNR